MAPRGGAQPCVLPVSRWAQDCPAPPRGPGAALAGPPTRGHGPGLPACAWTHGLGTRHARACLHPREGGEGSRAHLVQARPPGQVGATVANPHARAGCQAAENRPSRRGRPRRVRSWGLTRKSAAAKSQARLGGVKAELVPVVVIGSPFSDGRIRRGTWERHSHRTAVSASISQCAEKFNNKCAWLMLRQAALTPGRACQESEALWRFRWCSSRERLRSLCGPGPDPWGIPEGLRRAWDPATAWALFFTSQAARRR
jgi:hypothetical protein